MTGSSKDWFRLTLVAALSFLPINFSTVEAITPSNPHIARSCHVSSNVGPRPFGFAFYCTRPTESSRSSRSSISPTPYLLLLTRANNTIFTMPLRIHKRSLPVSMDRLDESPRQGGEWRRNSNFNSSFGLIENKYESPRQGVPMGRQI